METDFIDIGFDDSMSFIGQPPIPDFGNDCSLGGGDLGVLELADPSRDLTRAVSSVEIETVYTQLLQCVDQLTTSLSACPPLDTQIQAWVKEQSGKLVDRLYALERIIMTAERQAGDVGSPPKTKLQSRRRHHLRGQANQSQNTYGYVSPRSESSSALSRHSVDVRRGVGGRRAGGMRRILTPSPSLTECPESPVDVEEDDDDGGQARLARKLLQIGNPESCRQVTDFAEQLQRTEHLKDRGSGVLPSMQQVSAAAAQARGGGSSSLPGSSSLSFLSIVLDLGTAIENNTFGEQHSRIGKRIALAHFYHAYALAQENPGLFLSWCEKQQNGQRRQHEQQQFSPVSTSGRHLPTTGGNRSVVQQRFVDIIFSSDTSSSQSLSWCSPSQMLNDNDEDRHHQRRPRQSGEKGAALGMVGDARSDSKKKTAKIQMWRKQGKKWAQIIQRFGYGVLLILPASLSEEDIRLARDGTLSHVLDLVEARRPSFADTIQQANDLINSHFFRGSSTGSIRAQNLPQSQGNPDWGSLMCSPAL